MKIFFTMSGVLAAELIADGVPYSTAHNPACESQQLWIFALTKAHTHIVRAFFENRGNIPHGVNNVLAAIEKEAENVG